MNNYLYSGILFFSAAILGLVLYFLSTILLKRWLTAANLKEINVRLDLLKSPLRFLFPILCITVIMPLLRLPEKKSLILGYSISIPLIVSLSWLVIKVTYIVRDAILGNYNMEVKDNALARSMHTQLRMITNIVVVIIALLTIAFILMTFPGVRRIGVTILASAGVTGVVIGFAAQKTLANLIAGIQIAITQPIRLDDVVVIENEWGRIEEITLTFAVVRIWDLRRLVVPISYFLEKPFQNWTRTSADLLGAVLIYTDYTIPVKEVRNELTRILESSPRWDKKVNVLQVTDTTEKTVELRALMSAADSATAWDLRCEVREKLLEFLQQRFPECLPRIRIEMNKIGAV